MFYHLSASNLTIINKMDYINFNTTKAYEYKTNAIRIVDSVNCLNVDYDLLGVVE